MKKRRPRQTKERGYPISSVKDAWQVYASLMPSEIKPLHKLLAQAAFVAGADAMAHLQRLITKCDTVEEAGLLILALEDECRDLGAETIGLMVTALREAVH